MMDLNNSKKADLNLIQWCHCILNPDYLYILNLRFLNYHRFVDFKRWLSKKITKNCNLHLIFQNWSRTSLFHQTILNLMQKIAKNGRLMLETLSVLTPRFICQVENFSSNNWKKWEPSTRKTKLFLIWSTLNCNWNLKTVVNKLRWLKKRLVIKS